MFVDGDRASEYSDGSVGQISTPFVSVIVPVFNDSERLRLCLRALENQIYPKDRYEVIVVDNGSDEDIDSVVATFRGFQARTVKEERVSSYAARNKGVSLASGEVIAFTDSDCTPASDWIEKGVECLLRTPNPGLIAGALQLFCKNSQKPTAVELYDTIFGSRVREQVQVHKFGPTANLFTLKSVFARVGLFDDRLKSRGDFEWGRRVYSSGYAMIYAPIVRVAHPARYSFDQLRRKAVRIEGGVHDFGRRYTHSFAASAKGFLMSILHDVTLVCLHEELNLIQKVEVIFVMFSVRYVGLLERLRLALGGKSKR